MTLDKNILARQKRRSRLLWGVFFLLVFVYLYGWVDPHLIFFAHGTLLKLPIFVKGDVLAHDAWTRPGGMAVFASASVFRWFGRPWTAPALLTVLAWVLWWSTNRLVVSMGVKQYRAAGVVPVAVLLGLVGAYARPPLCLVYVLPLTLAFGAAALYTYVPRHTVVRFPVLVVLASAVYLFGAGTMYVFAAVCGVHELLRRRRWFLALIAVALAAGLPYAAGRWLYGVPLAEAYTRLTPLDTGIEWGMLPLHWVLFASAPVLMVLARVLRHRQRYEERLAWTAEALVLLILAAAALPLVFDRTLLTRSEPMAIEGLRAWVAASAELPRLETAYVAALALLLALLAASFYRRVSTDRALVRWGVFLYVSIFVYYTAGVAAFLFGVVCVIYELAFKRRWRVGGACLLWLAALPAIWAVFFEGRDFAAAYTRLLPLLDAPGQDTMPIVQRLPLWFCLAAAALSLWRAREAAEAEASAGFGRRKLGDGGTAVCYLLLLVVSAGAVSGALFDWEMNARLRLNAFARLGRWQEVLAESRGLAGPTRRERLDVECALHHTGRLTEDMFAYPLSRLGLVPGPVWREVLPYAEMYYEMGHMNAAGEFAYAAQVTGDHPLVIRLLGKIYLIKGEPETARVFFEALKQDPSCGHWADEYLATLQTDPGLSDDAEAKRLRALAIRKDRVFSDDFMAQVDLLLKANPRNRMAFELKMARLLLQNRLDEFRANLPRARQAGCTGPLRLYQEAALVHGGGADKGNQGIEIEEATRRRLEAFDRACESAGGVDELRRLVDEFGDSYFYYHRFVGK